MHSPLSPLRGFNQADFPQIQADKSKSTPSKSSQSASNMPRPHSPETQTVSSSITVSQPIDIDEQQDLLATTEKSLDDLLEDLERASRHHELIRNTVGTKKIYYHYADIGREVGEYAFETFKESSLEKLFPEGFADKGIKVMKFSKTGLHLIDTTFTGATLIFRGKILYAAKKSVEQAKAALEKERAELEELKNSDPLNEEIQQKEERIKKKEINIKECEVNIELEEEDFREGCAKFGIKTTKRILSNSKLLPLLIPQLNTIPYLGHVIQGLGWVAGGLALLLSSFHLKEGINNRQLHTEWTKNLKNVSQSAKDLSSKRKALYNRIVKNIEVLTPQLIEARSILFQRVESLLENDPTGTEWEKILRENGFTPDMLKDSNNTPLVTENEEQGWEFDAQFMEKLEANRGAIFTAWADSPTSFTPIVKAYIDHQESLSTKSKLEILRKAKIEHVIKKREELGPQLIEARSILFRRVESLLENDPAGAEWEKILRENGFTPDMLKDSNNTPLVRENEEQGWEFDAQFMEKLEANRDAIFTAWADSPTSFTPIVKAYIDHQETLSITAKGALKQMVQKKHALERFFLNFKLFESSLLFSVFAISLTITVTAAILSLTGVFTVPAAVLLAVSVIGTGIGVGLMVAGYYIIYKKKPSSFYASLMGDETALKISKFMHSLRDYQHRASLIKLEEQKKIVDELAQSKLSASSNKDKEKVYEDAWKAYTKAQENSAYYAEKLNYWHKRLNKIQQKMAAGSWDDFATQNQLKGQTAATMLLLNKKKEVEQLIEDQKAKVIELNQERNRLATQTNLKEDEDYKPTDEVLTIDLQIAKAEEEQGRLETKKLKYAKKIADSEAKAKAAKSKRVELHKLEENIKQLEGKKALNTKEKEELVRLTKQADKLKQEWEKLEWSEAGKDANLGFNTETKEWKNSDWNTLDVLEEALLSCDPFLLDKELDVLKEHDPQSLESNTSSLTYFLKNHLDIDLSKMRRLAKSTDSPVTKALQKFFALDDGGLIFFISRQRARQEKGILPKAT